MTKRHNGTNRCNGCGKIISDETGATYEQTYSSWKWTKPSLRSTDILRFCDNCMDHITRNHTLFTSTYTFDLDE